MLMSRSLPSPRLAAPQSRLAAQHRFRTFRFTPFAAALVAVAVSCSSSPNELLIRIARGDAEDRADAIVKLGEVLAEKEAAGFPFGEGDREALALLEDVAGDESDSLLRVRAIAALRQLQTFDHTEIWLRGLESRFWGVRWESAKSLLVHPVARAAPSLIERLHREPNRVVLLDAIRALARIENRAALRGLLEAFLDASGRFADHELKLHEAIRRLSGKGWSITEKQRWRDYLRDELGEDGDAVVPPAAPVAPEAAPPPRGSP